jgi:hypothetical protein
MGANHPVSPTGLEPFRKILGQRDLTGRPFVVVGGQAVNIWANYYLPREPRLQMCLPFTSKDLDVVAAKSDAERVASATGWSISPPPVRGGPVEAVLSSKPAGAGLKVEFLREILGVPPDTIEAYARENLVRVPGSDEPLLVRVLDPVFLLAGKLRNAVDIKQDLPDRPRQDTKHVTMLALCVPHFLEDVRAQATDRAARESICGRYVTILATLKNTYSGRQFEGRHPGVIRWQELVPQRVQRMYFDKEVRAALQHLVGQSQSRGIRI